MAIFSAQKTTPAGSNMRKEAYMRANLEGVLLLCSFCGFPRMQKESGALFIGMMEVLEEGSSHALFLLHAKEHPHIEIWKKRHICGRIWRVPYLLHEIRIVVLVGGAWHRRHLKFQQNILYCCFRNFPVWRPSPSEVYKDAQNCSFYNHWRIWCEHNEIICSGWSPCSIHFSERQPEIKGLISGKYCWVY